MLTDGKESLFLDFYFGYAKSANGGVSVSRKKEFLKLYLYPNATDPISKQQNKKTLDLAKTIRFERSQMILEDKEGYRIQSEKKNTNFIAYFQAYYDSYTKRDKAEVKTAFTRFIDFLRDTDEYSMYQTCIKPSQITKEMVEDFADYLQTRSKGEGAHAIFARFKKVVNYAIEHGVFKKNPCKGVSIKVDPFAMRKEILSEDEIRQLISCTPHRQMNPEIRRAFILSLMCGIRYCDVKDLTFENVDYTNKILKYEQNKTKGHSSASFVSVPLTEDVLNLIGEPRHDKKEKIFAKLPCYHACLNAVGAWVKRAGINKHITWHCARHSFATIVLNNGANIRTTADLLGHSTTSLVMRYTRVIDENKRAAVNSLPSFKI
ncbi:MAG: site-specific integrase [Prevotella sp.]|nr:site-specific integrase [Prevotella sp.]